jgi:hypothetical protein
MTTAISLSELTRYRPPAVGEMMLISIALLDIH